MLQKTDDTGETIMDALQTINRTLATINGRVEILLNAALPEYAISDLIQIYEAEKEVSQIVHNLNLFCHKRF